MLYIGVYRNEAMKLKDNKMQESKFNLDAQLSSKSENQIISMLKTRCIKEAEAYEYMGKYDSYPYTESSKHIAQIKKHKEFIDDLSDWMRAAYILFSYSMWDRMIEASGFCLEGNCHEDLRG